jgi:hypothetical protein
MDAGVCPCPLRIHLSGPITIPNIHSLQFCCKTISLPRVMTCQTQNSTGLFLLLCTAVEREFSKQYFLSQLVSILLSTFVKIMSLDGRVYMCVLLHSACCMRLKTGLRVLLLGAVSLRWPTWSGCHLFPSCLLVSNLGGMGSRHLWGPFASFVLVRDDDGDLPETSASSRARFCSDNSMKNAKNSCAHAWHSALRNAAIGPPGNKWQHPGNGHA